MIVNKRLLKYSIPIVMAMSLIGCKIDARIEAVDNATTFNAVDFNVTSNNKSINPKDVNYTWDFGDGSSATGQNPKHIYGKPGTYHVNLKMTYKNSSTIETVKKDIIIASPTASQSNQVLIKVTDSEGAIKDATVIIDGKEQKTNDIGFIKFDSVNAEQKVLIEIKADNYISQTIQLEPNNTSDNRAVAINLKKLADKQNISDIAAENTINVSAQNSTNKVSVSFAPDSFMQADGTKVEGTAEVRITPWDVSNQNDMNAFLGNGVAIDSSGQYTQLLSYGSMNVDFTQNGKPLQLKPGKYATISMPLPLKSHYDGKSLAAGDTIPMWYFSENTGAWIEDGVGEVYRAENGELMLKATVSHFTTWNWDMKFSNPSSLFIQCKLENGTPVPCNLQAKMSYPNGGYTVNKQQNIGMSGTTIINIDSSLEKISFNAGYFDVDTRTVYSGTQVVNLNDGSTTIVLKDKQTIDDDDVKQNIIEVTCQLEDGSKHTCNGFVKVAYKEQSLVSHGYALFEQVFDEPNNKNERPDTSKKDTFLIKLKESTDTPNYKVKPLKMYFYAEFIKDGKLTYHAEKVIDIKDNNLPSKVNLVLKEAKPITYIDVACHSEDGLASQCNGLATYSFMYADVSSNTREDMSKAAKFFTTTGEKSVRINFERPIVLTGMILKGSHESLDTHVKYYHEQEFLVNQVVNDYTYTLFLKKTKINEVANLTTIKTNATFMPLYPNRAYRDVDIVKIEYTDLSGKTRTLAKDEYEVDIYETFFTYPAPNDEFIYPNMKATYITLNKDLQNSKGTFKITWQPIAKGNIMGVMSPSKYEFGDVQTSTVTR